ncbi:MAG: CehA/McbA family metallohydrolase [Limisphaerales bacterium]
MPAALVPAPPRLLAVLLALASLLKLHAAPEAFEIGPANTAQLPRGKEADGIIGDFVLRNDRVEAVISGGSPHRRANMSTFYGTNGVTPGCLFDLTAHGANNDQLVIFTPLTQQGPVSHVRIVSDGKDGTAEVETVISAALNEGLFKRHQWQLRDGEPGILVISTLRNEGTSPRKGMLDDRWTRFASNGVAGDIRWADAEDPADKAGYAWAWLPGGAAVKPGQEVELAPGQSLEIRRFLAVGRSPAEAAGHVASRLGTTGLVRGTVKDAAGQPVGTAKILVPWGDGKVPAYPDAEGRFEFRLPPGEHSLEVTDIGRPSVSQRITVKPDEAEELVATLEAASAIAFDIRNEAGATMPCKAQFIGINGTPAPNLGPRLRAHGCADQWHSATGAFRVQVPPGGYRVVVTRGPEFSHLAREVTVPVGQTVNLSGELKRLVDTRGWVSADYHNHSTESGDNTCGTADRLINLAAEHIEFAPTTEHNRLFDWRPLINRLGLGNELQTVPGMELTGSGAHMNSFPFTPVPFTQDNGAPVWNADPRITALTLRRWQGEDPHRWVQINHPDMVQNFLDRDGDGQPDGGFIGLGGMIDAVETQNFLGGDLLAGAPFRIVRGAGGREEVRFLREFIWLQLLNRGARFWGTAVADAHSVHGNGVGGWRVYSPSATDEPGRIDWRENARNARAGRMILTTGPFLQVTLEDGTIAGGATRLPGRFNVHVRVQCTDWLDVDRVQFLVNGRPRPDLNFTRAVQPQMFGNAVVKFDQTVPVQLSEDAHLIVVAIGENSDLSTGFGSSDQANLRPQAYNNPIFVDVDGNGFVPNGDTLDFPLPHGGMTVAQAKALLERGGR